MPSLHQEAQWCGRHSHFTTQVVDSKGSTQGLTHETRLLFVSDEPLDSLYFNVILQHLPERVTTKSTCNFLKLESVDALFTI